MSANQVQRRGGTTEQVMGITPALRELLVNTTTKRVHVGDGSTAGGIILPNRIDLQNNLFSYKAAGGTANALTVTLDVPLTGYVEGQIVWFKAVSTNTGAATIDVNGHGVKSIYKDGGTGGVNLTGGEIVAGLLYGAIYQGSVFVLINPSPAAAASAGGMDLLAVATASASASLDFTSAVVGSGYVNYMLVLTGLLLSATTGGDLILRLSQGGSFKANAGDYESFYNGVQSITTSSVEISKYVGSTLANEASGRIYLHAVAGKYPMVSSEVMRLRPSNGTTVQQVLAYGSLIDANSQVDGIRILPKTGTITSGQAFLYGLRSSL
jgi:hypothetical protein